LWGVICNAGICADNAFPALSGEEWDNVIHTNLDAFYNVLFPLTMPMCRKKQGRIITIASIAGLVGNRGQVNYSASKAGIIGASKALAVELASRSITVNCIAPGIIETDMIENAPMEKILPNVPMHRIGKPEEVAALAVFLLSEGA
jgi:3-oxoacyl-[acyl-carrier protein] reductase